MKRVKGMEIEQFSSKYNVQIITNEDVKSVYELCRKNELYYLYCPPFVTEYSIRQDMRALPPQKKMDDKYYIGFFDGEHLIAVMDFIDAYPDAKTAFIGFFMTDISIQQKGVGTEIISELCDYLHEQHYKKVKLGWVKGNPQSAGFWHKNGFMETGVSYDTNGYTVIVAQRILSEL